MKNESVKNESVLYAKYFTRQKKSPYYEETESFWENICFHKSPWANYYIIFIDAASNATNWTNSTLDYRFSLSNPLSVFTACFRFVYGAGYFT